MKILHISSKRDHPCFWGLIEEQRKKHKIFFAVLNLLENAQCNITKEYKKNGISFIHIDTKRIVDFSYDSKLRNLFDGLLKKYQPHLVHIHLFSGLNIIPILNVASSLEIKKVITLQDHSLCCVKGILHNGYKKCSLQSLIHCNCKECREFAYRENKTLIEYNLAREERTRSIVAMCDKIICCSYTQKDFFCNLLGENDKFTALYYGVDLPRTTESHDCKPPHQNLWRGGKAVVRGLPTVNGVIKKRKSVSVFGYLGNLSSLKGISVIETALICLNHHNYKFEILMGILYKSDNPQDVAYLKRLKKYKNLKIFKNIENKELYNVFFSQIDYLIIPSLWEETGPMTLLESFFYKVPVIISNQSSMVEKIKGNKSSKVFNDTKELIKVMREIIEGKVKKYKNDIFNVKDIEQYSNEIESLYENIETKQTKALVLKTGYVCNNNCIFCVTGDNAPRTFVNFILLKKTLRDYRNTYGNLTLTGGEPSLHKDFFILLYSAYRLGYKISLQTNARVFSNKRLCEKIKFYNLNILTHLHSYQPRIHDLITRSPGSFNDAIRAVKNLRDYCREITVKIMLTKINYRHIFHTAKFIIKIPVDEIWFAFLTPSGYANIYFDTIVPYYSLIRPFIANTIAWLKENSRARITIEGIPYCCLESGLRKFVLERATEDRSSRYGVYPSGLKEDEYYCLKERVNQKQKFSQCKICKFDSLCEGVYKNYVEKRGSDEFIPVK